MTRSVKLTLVGAYAGQTVELRGGLNLFPFTDGSMEVTGPDEEVEALCRYLSRNFQAYPDPSPELDAARRAIHGDGDEGSTDPDAPGAGDEHPRGTNDDAGGAGAREPSGADPDEGSGAAGAPTGEAGTEAAPGHGQGPIAAALRKLDPRDDAHWTADGKPAMRAVEDLLGRSDVTRADVSAAIPGFNREAAHG